MSAAPPIEIDMVGAVFQRRATEAEGLCLQLAAQCGLGRLAGLDLAAWKLPQAFHRPPRRAARDQNTVISVDKRRGSDEQDG